MRSIRKLVSICLLAVLALAVCAPMAIGASTDPVPVADSLEVYLRFGSSSGNDTLLHNYSVAEMNGLVTGGNNIRYSSIDMFPSTVETIVTGVYLEDLITDALKGTTYTFNDVEGLRFTATDGAMGNYSSSSSYQDLMSYGRYYFPDIHAEDTGGLTEDGELRCVDPGYGDQVRPMLAITGIQGRRPMPASEYRSDKVPEAFTLCFGMTAYEAENTIHRTFEFKRGIYMMVICLPASLAPDDSVKTGSGTDSGSGVVTAISIEQKSVTVTPKQKVQLSAMITPVAATDKSVTWSSGNTGVATVDQNGLVTGLSLGQATITATSANGLTTTCTIIVADHIVEVTGISLSRASLIMLLDSERTLTATVEPYDASNKDVSWKSSDETIVTVDADGKLKAVGVGAAVITAGAGDYCAECKITVTDEVIAVQGVTLDHTTLSIKTGETFQFTATIDPQGVTDDTVYWSSSAPGVASVDTNGLMTAINPGSVTISVRTEDGSFRSSCAVTVLSASAAPILSDISEHWAKDSIEEMSGKGFISGDPDGRFRPEDSITRAEFMKILILMLEDKQSISLQTGTSFDDAVSHWAADYISTAVALGITSGYGNGLFAPDDRITREQAAVFMTKAVEEGAGSNDLSFSDSEEISDWSLSAVAYAFEQGWVTGYPDGSFGPQQSMTRAESCVMLLRFYQSI